MTFPSTVTTTFTTGQTGQLCDNNPATISSNNYFCEDTSIGFGLVVQEGTATNQAKLGGDGTSIGVSVRVMKEKESGDSTTQYNQYDAMTILQDGEIYVSLGNTASAGADIYYNDTTGVIYAGTASTGQTQFPTGSKLLQTASTAGDIVKIRVRNMVV